MAMPSDEQIEAQARRHGVNAQYLKQYYEQLEASPPEPGEITDDLIKEQAARLGVNYQFLRQHYEQSGAIAPMGETPPETP